MVLIPAGKFTMGADFSDPSYGPAHEVEISAFWLDRYEVTNKQFEEFVQSTGYKTIAERELFQKDFPNLPPEALKPFSICFKIPDGTETGEGSPPWWQAVYGADWRHPDGPGSDIVGKELHPVVHISWDDAMAYCKWAKKRLPTEAEFEYACRGGLESHPYCWGNEVQGTNGKWFANTYQGFFPTKDTAEDGFAGLAPIASYPPNGYGLYDISGNAWEWCSDWFAREYYKVSPKKDPQGPETGEHATHLHPSTGPARVRRGGSYLCADDYCKRYVPYARDANPPNDAACHTGFRCARSVQPNE
ncbi:MAG: formylglycine-generating enzyme family protein [Zavarzinella sp.]